MQISLKITYNKCFYVLLLDQFFKSAFACHFLKLMIHEIEQKNQNID